MLSPGGACWPPQEAPVVFALHGRRPVYVQYLPLTTEGKISWWNDNKDKLQEKYQYYQRRESLYRCR
ncbi:DUF943 family protein [Serratia ureilytica]|nr:DUF943 family protein [Serratia ureilytica]